MVQSKHRQSIRCACELSIEPTQPTRVQFAPILSWSCAVQHHEPQRAEIDPVLDRRPTCSGQVEMQPEGVTLVMVSSQDIERAPSRPSSSRTSSYSPSAALSARSPDINTASRTSGKRRTDSTAALRPATESPSAQVAPMWGSLSWTSRKGLVTPSRVSPTQLRTEGDDDLMTAIEDLNLPSEGNLPSSPALAAMSFRGAAGLAVVSRGRRSG